VVVQNGLNPDKATFTVDGVGFEVRQDDTVEIYVDGVRVYRGLAQDPLPEDPFRRLT
jgi:hypothetical protein